MDKVDKVLLHIYMYGFVASGLLTLIQSVDKGEPSFIGALFMGAMSWSSFITQVVWKGLYEG